MNFADILDFRTMSNERCNGVHPTLTLQPPQILSKPAKVNAWRGFTGPVRLFLGHPQAGWRSAVIYSIIGSCRRRGLNPQEYLSDVLRRLPGLKMNELDSLLPGNWKPPTLNSS